MKGNFQARFWNSGGRGDSPADCSGIWQMQWTKRGAHLLLQTRVKTLNGELGEVFKRWYPDMQVEELAEAA